MSNISFEEFKEKLLTHFLKNIDEKETPQLFLIYNFTREYEIKFTGVVATLRPSEVVPFLIEKYGYYFLNCYFRNLGEDFTFGEIVAFFNGSAIKTFDKVYSNAPTEDGSMIYFAVIPKEIF